MRNFHKLQLYSGPIIKDILFHSLVLIGTNSSETSVCVLRSLPFFLFLRSFPLEFNFRSFPYLLKTKNKPPHSGLWYCRKTTEQQSRKIRQVPANLENCKWKAEFLSQLQDKDRAKNSCPSLLCQPYSLPSNGAAAHRKVAAGILLGLQRAFTQASVSLPALIKFLNNNQLSWSKTTPFVQDFCLPHC